MSGNFIVDLTNYKERVGARVEPGRYRVIVDDTEMDQSKAGNQMINVWFRILDGEYEGKTITDRLTLTEKALFRVVGFMSAIGLPTPKKRLQLNLRKFNGQILEIEVRDGEPYNGRVKSEVADYYRASKKAAPASEALPEEEDEEEVESEVEGTLFDEGGSNTEDTDAEENEDEDTGTVDLDDLDNL